MEFKIRIVVAVAAVLAASVVLDENSAAARQQTPATLTVKDGLRTVTMDGPEARVTVKLPDDVRSGDQITATVVTEPKGSTPEEQEKSRAALRARIIRLIMTRSTGSGDAGQPPPVVTVPLSGESTSAVKTFQADGKSMRIEFSVTQQPDLPFADSGMQELGRTTIPIDIVPPATPLPTPKGSPAPRPLGPNAFDEEAYEIPPAGFSVPPMGQHGRPVQILGPFDGSAATTEPKLGIPDNTSDLDLFVIAESPRKAILENPSGLTGLGRMSIREGGVLTSAPFRNVAVRLSAPKTALSKGETTELRVQVDGLLGISEPVPATLTAAGVITMSGGPYQSFLIEPSQVSAAGSYVTTRLITGIVAGGWSASLSVFTGSFDVCLQDDSIRGLILRWNSLTGEYSFSAGGAFLEGRGKVKLKDCSAALEDNSSGRKLRASADLCTQSGTAEARPPSSRTVVKLIDGNMADNICLLQ